MRLRSIIVALIVGLLFLTSTERVIAEEDQDFQDLIRFDEEIHYLRDSGVVNGFTDTLFYPKAPIKRIDAVRMIMRELDPDLETVEDPGFTDVSKDHDAYKAVAKAKELGIIDGMGDGTFQPEGKLTRAQMAKILVNAYKLEGTYEESFEDLSEDYWGYPYISTLAHHKITIGYTDGTFRPTKEISRQNFSAFLARHLNDYFKPNQETPELSVEAVNNTTVRLTFDQPVSHVKTSGAIEGIRYGMDVKGYESITKVNDSVYEVHFPFPLYEYQEFMIDYGQITQGTTFIEDEDGNSLRGGVYPFSHEDTTPPEVTGMTYKDQNKIVVSFSEQVQELEAGDHIRYALSSEEHGNMAISHATLNEKGDKVTLETASSLTGSQTFTLFVNGIVDYSQNENEMEPQSITETFSSMEKAPLVDFTWLSPDSTDVSLQDSQTAYILFVEEMEESALLDQSHYNVQTKDGDRLAADEFTVSHVADHQGVLIESKNDSIAGGTVVVSGIPNHSGQVMRETTAHIPEQPTKPALEDIVIDDDGHIHLRFNQKLKEADFRDFAVSVNDEPYRETEMSMSTLTNKRGKGTITLYPLLPIDESEIADGLLRVQSVQNAAVDPSTQEETSGTKTLLGEQVDLEPVVVLDGSKPKLMRKPDSIATRDFNENGNIDHIQLFFQEPIDPNSVHKDQFEVEGYTITDVEVGGRVTDYEELDSYTADRLVQITVQELEEVDGYKQPKVTVQEGLRDLAGNVFDGVENKEAKDRVQPMIFVIGDQSNDTVTVIFSEPIGSGIEEVHLSDGAIYDTSTAIKLYNEGFEDPIGLAFETIAVDDLYSVEYIIEPNTITDVHGNYVEEGRYPIYPIENIQ